MHVSTYSASDLELDIKERVALVQQRCLAQYLSAIGWVKVRFVILEKVAYLHILIRQAVQPLLECKSSGPECGYKYLIAAQSYTRSGSVCDMEYRAGIIRVGRLDLEAFFLDQTSRMSAKLCIVLRDQSKIATSATH